MCVYVMPSPGVLTCMAHETWTLPTPLSAMHWYMPVSPTTELEIVRVLMLQLPPLTEIIPRGFPPLWYQVTVGVGIPSTTQVKVTVSIPHQLLQIIRRWHPYPKRGCVKEGRCTVYRRWLGRKLNKYTPWTVMVAWLGLGVVPLNEVQLTSNVRLSATVSISVPLLLLVYFLQ